MMGVWNILLIVAATSVGAQRIDIAIDNRTLTAAEAAEYRAVESDIACAFDAAQHDEATVATLVEINERIASTSLFDGAKETLMRVAGEAAFARSGTRPTLARDVLKAPQPNVRELALQFLVNSPELLRDAAVRDELLRLLRDPTSTTDERVGVVWLFAAHGGAAAVRDTAFALASDHRDPELAHGVAEAIVSAVADASLTASPARAIREEAVRLAYHCEAAGTDVLVAVARDVAEPPQIRGNALEALTRCANERVLLDFTKHSRWFFGAAGEHFPVHSLTIVIPALAGLNTPAARARLQALRSEIAALPDGERQSVEHALASVTRR